MKKILSIVLAGWVIISVNTFAQNKKERIQLVRNDSEKKVDVIIDGKLFTSYIYPETIKKPVLYPLKTAEGTSITRGFPLEPKAGERVDHPHHVGLWFNYGDVNGLDFWNNSDAIDPAKRSGYGTILHQSIDKISGGKDKGTLQVTTSWVGPDKTPILKEETTFIFRGEKNSRTIDRITKLTALDKDVSMKDNKEGVLGIRVTRALEHPSNKPELFTDANGLPTNVPVLNNEGVNGMYISSEGKKGDDVWGTRGKWVNLHGTVDGKKVSLVMIDHPQNPGYPTYWHARGYGLFAANPLGQKELSGGKDVLNFQLPAGESVTFRHRIVIHSGDLANEQINKQFENFSKEK